MVHFDVAVVGAGPIGSSAARHLAKAGLQVVVIGPDEPLDPDTHDGVFASHYDQARITRTIDPDPLWQRLAIISLQRYSEIERLSGITFYQRCGHISVASSKKGTLLAAIQASSEGSGKELNRLVNSDLARIYPDLKFPTAAEAFSDAAGGYINPRAFVKAQLKLAQQSGAVLLKEQVHSISANNDRVAITTPLRELEASRAIVACGCYTKWLMNLKQLKVQGRTVVLLELPDSEVQRLAGMPSIIFEGEEESDNCYILPPVRYPNGSSYIKIGGRPYDLPLESADDVANWFNQKTKQKNTQDLLSQLLKLVPLKYLTGETKNCVLTLTDSGRPIIDYSQKSERIVIASGGNGGAAKSAEEIGRLAAGLVSGAWFSMLDRKLFSLRT